MQRLYVLILQNEHEKQQTYKIDMGSIFSKNKKETGSPAGGIQLELFQAARTGDCTRLARLLECGADVNACDPWGTSPLYYACLGGHCEAAQMLLEAGADYSKNTVEGERCYRAALNLDMRRLLREYEAAPLAPLPAALRSAFLACAGAELSPDITFYVQGRPIEAHRVILAARSPFFRKKLTTVWRNRKGLTLTFDGSYSVSFEAVYGLVHFFYTDRLEVPEDDIDDLARVCQACECEGLLEMINRLFPRKRLHREAGIQLVRENHPQKRVVLQLQRRFAQDRLPSALLRLLRDCLANSREEEDLHNNKPADYDDLADIRIKVGDRVFRCHQMILASRSEYFKTRLSRRPDFLERHGSVLEEHDVSAEAFEKMLEYVYTDELEHLGDDPLAQAEELLDIASRYLLFPLKRLVADLLLPHLHLDRVSLAQLCRWLTLSDMYELGEVREHCLDIVAGNFEAFAEAREFRALLLTQQTSVDLLSNDLRERWLGAAGAGLDGIDESAALFDRRLEMLVLAAEQEGNDDQTDSFNPLGFKLMSIFQSSYF